MKLQTTLLAAMVILARCSTTNENMITPPEAKKIKKELTTHGDTRVDNYFWMRLSDKQKEAKKPDGQTQDVLDYMNAENDYLNKMMKHTKKFQTSLFNEIKGRIKQDDASVPFTKNGYSYYTRFEKGQDYAFYCRKLVADNSSEEVMLDGPAMGKGKSYFAIGGQSVSTNNKLLAYSVDLVSRREYTIHVKDMSTGKILSDKITNTTGNATWANDNKTLFYTKQDPITLRSYQIYKHVIGTDQSQDKLVYEEKDDTFGVGIHKTKSGKYLMITCWQTLSTEHRYLDADNPNGEWKTVLPREDNHEYSVDHFGDDFYIVSNEDAKNFKLVKTPVSNTSKSNWDIVLAHRDDVYIEDIELFKNHMVVSERSEGLNHLRIIKWDGNDDHYIKFNDPAYTAYVGMNPEFDTDVLRYGYTSLTTPNSVYDYNMNNKGQEMLKQAEVMDKNFSPDNYASERVFVTARDGAKVPISIVYKKGMKKDGKAPLLLYGYGSYGASMDPYFSSVRLSLLDRGFTFAIAHIRGGQEMGRDWYENGKLLKKMNTFNDFIDCGQYLVDNKYTSKNHLYAQGGSAGGLLMGAVINMAPDMWNGVLAGVPFVDVVSTMLDESIPLTTGEFDEWGNPKNKEYYDYMKSYSPYDNIKKMDYPNLLITTGYWDSQVQYWEPAKWIAKLRAHKTDANLLMMYCNMDVGHGGASGRFERYKEVAMEYAFLFDLEAITE
ncbi:MAG: S9 family peptidase [Crocinitomicaceae bacterium]|nr:S9 family peptidase [Crocinitomicaceae bacterium]